MNILTTLTSKQVLDKVDNGQLESDFALYNEQESKLIDLGFEEGFDTIISVEHNNKVNELTIQDAIDLYLNSKSGIDLVEFDNGRIGFVGDNDTYFEML